MDLEQFLDDHHGIKTGCRNLTELLVKYGAKSSKQTPGGLTIIWNGRTKLYFGWSNYHGQYVQTGDSDISQKG